MSIKRYKIVIDREVGVPVPKVSSDGDLVSYKDHLAVVAELEAKISNLRDLMAECEDSTGFPDYDPETFKRLDQ
jgi:roadblock/LC7 domain-containing protein